MSALIKLLPDHLANQIAAGEVVQRPASVVKELMENSIDAGATRISLVIKDAGKALIQVSDNGSGMEAGDARMCFERHATSKISNLTDLFQIRTMGFRGEALASIAAVAQVQLRTRVPTDDLGTEVVIEGGEFKRQEPVLCPAGTSFAIKNLFFNVPARRNFLKSNPVETRHILNEFIRIALSHPEVHLLMEHNGESLYDLPPSSLEERIVAVMGKDLKGQLIGLEESTPYVQIHGFVGKPEAARKARGENFFFVNTRFIRSPYLHHALNQAFDGLIKDEHAPFYCLYFTLEPQHVDINIHPTKTEVKFDDERTLYALLFSVVKKALAIVHDVPAEGLESANPIANIIARTPPPQDLGPTIGEIRISGGSKGLTTPSQFKKQQNNAWEELYQMPGWPKESPNQKESLFPEENPPENQPPSRLFSDLEAPPEGESFLVQYQNRFILTPGKKGLILIDQNLAHQRILFESFLDASKKAPLASQQLLFPIKLNLAGPDSVLLEELDTEMRHLGFDIHSFGPGTFMLQGLPPGVPPNQGEALVQELLAEVRDTGGTQARDRLWESMARTLARRAAVPSGKKLSNQEMREIADTLFRCATPGESPGGKPAFYSLPTETLLSYFHRNP